MVGGVRGRWSSGHLALWYARYFTCMVPMPPSLFSTAVVFGISLIHSFRFGPPLTPPIVVSLREFCHTLVTLSQTLYLYIDVPILCANKNRYEVRRKVALVVHSNQVFLREGVMAGNDVQQLHTTKYKGRGRRGGRE